jgi:hypothetical protein
MHFNPLRTEFVLAGLAQVIGVLAVAEAIALRHTGGSLDLVAQAEALDTKGLVVSFSIFLILAYVVGILVVQLTFFIPTEYLIAKVRSERWNDLRQVEERLRSTTAPINPNPCLMTMAFRDATDTSGFWSFYWGRMERFSKRLRSFGRGNEVASDNPEQHAKALLLTLGRATAPPELAEEYRYRRSNRQVFVSLMPTVLLAGVALVIYVTQLPLYGAIPAMLGTGVLIVGLVGILWQSVLYQERIAQALIVDVAFLRRWDPTFPPPA